MGIAAPFVEWDCAALLRLAPVEVARPRAAILAPKSVRTSSTPQNDFPLTPLNYHLLCDGGVALP